MDENMEFEELEDFEDDIIILKTEDGEEVEFYHLATIDYGEKVYDLLEPVELFDDLEEGDIFIFEVDESGDEPVYDGVEDQELMDAVYAEYIKQLEELGYITLDEDCDCGCCKDKKED